MHTEKILDDYMDENEALRKRVQELEAENARLKSHFGESEYNVFQEQEYHLGWCNLEIKRLNADCRKLQAVVEAANKFIRLSPSDPDILPDQHEAYMVYLESLEALEVSE